ncbi:MAG UNVERIFIED_CONTAM: hypothetical protein LVR29_23785 [Microcystis novacekii LVE1205-3]
MSRQWEENWLENWDDSSTPGTGGRILLSFIGIRFSRTFSEARDEGNTSTPRGEIRQNYSGSGDVIATGQKCLCYQVRGG